MQEDQRNETQPDELEYVDLEDTWTDESLQSGYRDRAVEADRAGDRDWTRD